MPNRQLVERGKYAECIAKAINFNIGQIELAENSSLRLSDANSQICDYDEMPPKVAEKAWRCSEMMGMFDAATEAACLDKAMPKFVLILFRYYGDRMLRRIAKAYFCAAPSQCVSGKRYARVIVQYRNS